MRVTGCSAGTGTGTGRRGQCDVVKKPGSSGPSKLLKDGPETAVSCSSSIVFELERALPRIVL